MLIIQKNISNKEALVSEFLKRKDFKECKEEVETSYYKNKRTVFITQLQILITKLGLIVSELMLKPKLIDGNCSLSISYLTQDILDKPGLYKILRALEINKSGNMNKHSLDEVKLIETDSIVSNYNFMCECLASKLRINAFNNAKINKVSVNPINRICSESNCEKYLMIGNVKTKLTLSSNSSIDRYNKVVNCKLSIKLDGLNEYYNLSYSIKNNDCNGRIITKGTTSFSNSKSLSLDLPIRFAEVNANNGVNIFTELELTKQVKTKVKSTKTISYETGRIFKKTISKEIPVETTLTKNVCVGKATTKLSNVIK